jgi:hypothetical protein
MSNIASSSLYAKLLADSVIVMNVEIIGTENLADCPRLCTVQPQKKNKYEVPGIIKSVYGYAQCKPRERTSAEYRVL